MTRQVLVLTGAGRLLRRRRPLGQGESHGKHQPGLTRDVNNFHLSAWVATARIDSFTEPVIGHAVRPAVCGAVLRPGATSGSPPDRLVSHPSSSSAACAGCRHLYTFPGWSA